MEKRDRKFLKALLATPSPTGCEQGVASLVRARLKDTAQEVTTDVMGSVHARLAGCKSGPALMVAAHMDEVSLMVKYIGDDGFLRISTVGGVDSAVLPGLRVDVHTASGVLRGVVGRKPIHLINADDRKSVTPMCDLFIDLGLPGKKVKKLVHIGDQITYGTSFERYGKNMAVGKSFDDKCGVYVAVRALEEVARKGGAAGDFICAATVQEEIGLRGAETSGYALKPDVALAFDVTHATDYPGIDQSRFGKIVCGGGPVISRGPNINPLVFERLVAAAEAEGIPYQVEAEPGNSGTDACAIQMQRGGIATGLVGVALRYMHTPSEVICLDDLELCVRLIARFALDLEADATFIPGVSTAAAKASDADADEQAGE